MIAGRSYLPATDRRCSESSLGFNFRSPTGGRSCPGPALTDCPSPTVCAWIVIAMLAMIVIPAVITLQTVHHPASPIPVDQNSTPHGYTFSLLLFIVPTVFIAGWFLPSEGLHIPKRAFCWTLAILVPLGFSAGFLLRPVVLRLSQCGRDPGLARSRARQAGSGGRVRLLFHRLSCRSSSIHLAGRVLAGGLQRRLTIQAKPNRCAASCNSIPHR